jgi:hypothetical protein
MKCTTVLPALSFLLPTMIRSPQAAEVARDEYLKLAPLDRPRLVPQTAASAALHLYGDR